MNNDRNRDNDNGRKRVVGEELPQGHVYRRGEEGCHTYRIPSLVQAADATLIALAEGRRDNSRDPGGGHIDLVCKLSRDRGRSWTSRRYFDASREGWSASNPTSVVHSEIGRVLVLFNRWKPGRGGRNSRSGTRDNQLWMRCSDDHGDVWSEAVDITGQGRDIERWGKTVFGPGHGIETGGGRLVIPANRPLGPKDLTRTSSFALISDDGGQSWRRGEPIDALTCENQIVELEGGRLMMDARQREDIGTRWVATSDDGGETWGEPRAGQAVTPICAGITRHPGIGDDHEGLLVWTGPRGPGRQDLVLRLGVERGRSFPVELAIGSGPAAYSDLAVLDDGSLGILWEGGVEDPYEGILFTRVPREVIGNLSEAL